MKKNLFFALFACVALVFASCEPKPTPVEYTITLDQTEVVLEEGGQVKLNARITPVGEQVPAITWTTSNPDVATVSGSGIVEAKGLGTATISAALNVEGVAPATCTVNVTNDAVLNNFELGGMGLFNLGATIAGTDTVLKISAGEVKCQLAPSVYYIWDNNIVYNNGLGGAGFMAVLNAYTYVITDGPYAGYYIGDIVYVDTVAEDALVGYTAQAGQLLDVNLYGDAWKTLLLDDATDEEVDAAYAAYNNSQTGTPFFYIDWSTMNQSFYYGNVSYLQILEDDSLGLIYDLKLEWYDYVNENRWFGLMSEEVITEAGDTTLTIVEPYDMRLIHKEYSTWPVVEEEEETEEAPRSIRRPLYISEKQNRVINDLYKMYKK